MSDPVATQRPRSYGLIFWALAGALVIATGAPVPKTLDLLTGAGLPDLWARAVLYAAPLLTLIGVVIGARLVTRGRRPVVRSLMLGFAGAIVGFVMAFCLDLFAAAPAALTALTGPLAEPGPVEQALWVFGGISLVIALLILPLAIFGSPAMQALNMDEEMDPEVMDIRRSERVAFALSSLGLATLGIAVIALSVARQSGPEAALGPVIVALAAGVVSIVINIVLWLRFDELQRRQVVDGYASSAVIVTGGLFFWALAQVLNLVPPVDAGGVFLLLCVIQFIAVSWVAGASFSGSSVRRQAT